MPFNWTTIEGYSVSVYYVAVRTIVLWRHGSNLARPFIIHGLIYVPSNPCCGFFGVSPDGNYAYVHWGSFTSSSKSVRRAIWFTWLSEPHECMQHLAVLGGHPSKYQPGATLLNFSDRAQTVERTLYSVSVYSALQSQKTVSASFTSKQQSQKAVSAYFTSKQILPFGFAEQYGRFQSVLLIILLLLGWYKFAPSHLMGRGSETQLQVSDNLYKITPQEANCQM